MSLLTYVRSAIASTRPLPLHLIQYKDGLKTGVEEGEGDAEWAEHSGNGKRVKQAECQ